MGFPGFRSKSAVALSPSYSESNPQCQESHWNRVALELARPGSAAPLWKAATLRGGAISFGLTNYSEEETEAPDDQQWACEPCEHRAEGQEFLGENQHRQTDDPVKVHDTAKKQDRHQTSAAPEAIGAVMKTHVERTPCTLPPMMGEEGQRPLTVREADVLQGRQLIKACIDQDCRSEKIAGGAHHM